MTRVAIVSAHYPPNFVSGGTLVPQRTAHGLARRGWDVGVFAGWLGEGKETYEAWDSVDEEGVPVRWIATFFLWRDRRNFDNPPVAAAFGDWLDRFQPDLVHFHSLQTLGAGLVEQAVERGLKVVVTLHDFWWWCARQFMAERDGRPCCLVVDAGICPCEVDRAWLDERRRFTMAALAKADRVMAVSSVCAQVAAANGVDPQRLIVAENGIVALPHITRRPTGDGSLRFMFAGGTDPMKGGHVLLDAAATLAGTPGWVLECYGCEQWEDTVKGLPVSALPAFAPGDLGRVLSGADVLVVPSIMRETYSIMAREAISHGLPVVCSDCLGPEEVVEDRSNGLIVPTGDAAALATAMASLVQDRELLGRLQAGCTEVAMPTVDEQVDGLVALYHDVLEPPAAPPPAVREVSKVLWVVGIDGAPLRYRAHLPAEALACLGVEVSVRHYRHPDISRLGEEADVVVMYRVPATIQISHFIAGVKRRGTPVLFDVDDLIFDPDLKDEIPALRILGKDDAALWLQGVKRYRTTMEQCDGFIGSTQALCRHASAVVGLPSWRFANGVGMELGRLSDAALRRERTPGRLRIGYFSGTNTHDHDWRFVEPAVADVLRTHTDAELWLVGLVEAGAALLPFSDRVRKWPLMGWRELPAVLRDIDVNLAPMEPGSRFNEAKSAIKWLEAALTATPTVASPTEPFCEVIVPGRNGFTAQSARDWSGAVGGLLDDAVLRARVGRRARRDAVLQFSPALQGRRYLDILRSARPYRSGASAWQPVALDEPFAPVELEPYPQPPPDPPAAPQPAPNVVAPSIADQIRLHAGALAASLRSEGVVGAWRRSLRYWGRQIAHLAHHRRRR